MKTFLPALLAALSLVLIPAPSFAEKGGNGNGNGHGNGNRARGEDGFCPPGLAERVPACTPPGQARHRAQEDSDGERPPIVVLPDDLDVVPEPVGDRERAERSDRDDDNGEAALAIVGALIGLAMIERANRERGDDAPEVVAAPAPWSPPEVPLRPESFALLAEPEAPAVEPPDMAIVPDVAAPVAAEPDPVANPDEPAAVAEPSLIPPPPPLAEDEAPTSADLADAFERAQQSGNTGF